MESALRYNLLRMHQVEHRHMDRRKYKNNRWKCYSICPLDGTLPNMGFEMLYRQHRWAGTQRHSDNWCCIRLRAGHHRERYCLVQLKIMVCVRYAISGLPPDAIKWFETDGFMWRSFITYELKFKKYFRWCSIICLIKMTVIISKLGKLKML